MKKLIEKPLHISQGMTGKMSGIPSMSTSRELNKQCYYNSKVPGSVCEKCYAARYLKMRPALRECLENNFRILTEKELSPDAFPVVNSKFFRLESFGDLENVTQFLNYCTFAEKPGNEKTTFSLWTKNPHIIAAALKKREKPRNMIIIYSSLYLNNCDKKTASVYPFIDKVFTVWDKAAAIQAGITINCGARKCLECGRCYSKRTGKYIHELLK